MSCEIDITDIVNEMKKGTATPVAGLPENQVLGVLTAVAKTVNQAPTVITAKGLGTYGLSVADLQLTGIVKCGVDPTNLIADILSDPSVFTGKDNVGNVSDLTTNEALQQKLMNEKINANMNSLKLQGALTGNETGQELASLAGQSSKFSPLEVISNLLGTAGDVLGAAMDALGALAAAGALIAAVKNADILGKLKGFGAKIASLPELATNVLDTSDTDSGVDAIVGSSRIPSAQIPAPEMVPSIADYDTIKKGDYT